MRKVLLLGITVLGVFLGAWLLNAQALTGDEILQRASEAGSITAQGSRISVVAFEITDRNDITVPRKFAFFSKRETGQPDKLLIFFLEPELERGTIFLSIDPIDPAEDTRLWLFLSALGQAKELISDQDRSTGFAGSNLQNDQIGSGFDFSGDYAAELLGEETISVNWLGQAQARPVFKIALTQKPEADVDFPSGTAWIDTEEFVVLKAELNNKAGVLEQVSTLNDFVEVDGDIETSVILVKNVLDDSQTMISISDRQTVDNLPDDLFTVEALPSFDPAQFGAAG